MSNNQLAPNYPTYQPPGAMLGLVNGLQGIPGAADAEPAHGRQAGAWQHHAPEDHPDAVSTSRA